MISVLIPTYNRASFLPGTLGSVFAQSVPVDEVILVDDGSTDNTAEVVESLLVQHPDWKSRLRYVQQENQGKSVALNNALKLAHGQWIAFNDSDDAWLPEKLEWQFRALTEFPECGACFTESSLKEFQERHQARFLLRKGHFGKVEEPSWLFYAQWPGIYMQSVIVRKNVMQKCGELDPLLRVEGDVDFLFRLGLVTDFCYVDLPLLEIHRDPGRAVGLMTAYPSQSLPRILATEARLRSWLSLVGESRPALRRAVRHELASVQSALANRYVLEDDFPSARLALRKGMKECFELRLFAKWAMTYLMPAFLRRLVSKRVPTSS